MVDSGVSNSPYVDFSKIERGDYVVHSDFGVGRYCGLSSFGNEECMVIKYQKTTINVYPSYFNRVSFYKKGGVFYLSTRNRVSPLAINHIFTNKPIQVAPSMLNRCGHVREFSPSDLRDIAIHTNLFLDNTIYSQSSIPILLQKYIDKQTLAMEKFLGKKFLQEELYDAIHFISNKT